MKLCLIACSIVLFLAASGFAIEPSSKAKEVPTTRPLLKQALEGTKLQSARFPLPVADSAQSPSLESLSADLGREVLNSTRLRNLYLPQELLGDRRDPDARSRQKPRDPNMTLDQSFALKLVWIASRANNCHYCVGHQEVKLRSIGVGESEIAALDCRWNRFSAAEQAAFAFARKLTLRPDRLTDEDLQKVQSHYTRHEMLQIAFLVSRYNMANRWNSTLGVPQEAHRELLTETPAEFRETESVVAVQVVPERPSLESLEVTRVMLEKARSRSARLPLSNETHARQVFGDPSGSLPQWVRLLANFPVEGEQQIYLHRLSLEKGSLSEELKAQIAWTVARQDRAWYALGLAAKRLQSLSYTEAQTFALDEPEHLDESHAVAIRFAKKLAVSSQHITDADVAKLRDHFSDTEAVEIIYHIARAAFFDRITEVAALPLEP